MEVNKGSTSFLFSNSYLFPAILALLLYSFPLFSPILHILSTVKNLSVAVLDFSKSSHGRVFFHIKIFLGSVLIWTLWDLIIIFIRWPNISVWIVLLYFVHGEKPFCSSSWFVFSQTCQRAPMGGFSSRSRSFWDHNWFGHCETLPFLFSTAPPWDFTIFQQKSYFQLLHSISVWNGRIWYF